MSKDTPEGAELGGLGDEDSLGFSNLDVLERACGYTFNDRAWLKRALTHPSYANERKQHSRNNQRMEFLGDSVVGLVTARALFARDELGDEGVLTRNLSALVCERALAQKARELDLGSFIKLGKGEDFQGGRDRPGILCDAYEALMAAIFLDGGYDAVCKVIERLHGKEFAHIRKPPPTTPNYKGQLQTLTQSLYGVQPTYSIADSQGPEHSKDFVAHVFVRGERVAQGTGRSKKAAQQDAALRAFESLSAEDSTTS